jgi:hypothetical protein
MTYGVSSAPAIFQKIMEQILAGIENCVIYLDDILLCASDLKEMDKLLHNVFTRLNEFNVKINEKKCRLFRSEVVYLGYEISANGVRPLK